MKRKQYPIHPDFAGLSKINPPIDTPALPLIQKSMNLLYHQQKSDKQVRVEKIKIPIRNGKKIRALLFIPENLNKPAPAFVDYHGGGFVFPAAPYHYALAREYALEAQCIVLFPVYRLAPKHPFPAAVYDAYDSYLWLLDQVDQLGIDPKKIAVGGDSAGGQLAAVVCLMAKEHHIQEPCGQMLIYPAAGDVNTPSQREFVDTPMCNTRDMETYTRLYMPEITQEPKEYSSPISAKSLKELPPAYVETAEFDALRDGGILYADRLQREGVPVELNNTKGTIHGFDFIQKSPIVKQAVAKRIAFLKRIFDEISGSHN